MFNEHSFDKPHAQSLFALENMKKFNFKVIIRGGRHKNPIQKTSVIYRIFPKEKILNKYFLEERIKNKLMIK
jgi:hypothetical protein